MDQRRIDVTVTVVTMVIVEKVTILYLMDCKIREEQLSSSPVESRKAKQPAREVRSHQIYAFLSDPVCVLWLPSAIQITKYGMSFCVGLGRQARKYICPTIARYLLAADIRFVLSPASWAIAGGAEGRWCRARVDRRSMPFLAALPTATARAESGRTSRRQDKRRF